jgi:hypothetical protein
MMFHSTIRATAVLETDAAHHDSVGFGWLPVIALKVRKIQL